MARAALSALLRHLSRLPDTSSAADATDRHLLRRYVAGRDEAAFEALVYRHASLVWGVCRRLLREEHDAEDAFQAAFLVLVRKAGSLRARESLANWLHAVAYRVALKARVTAMRRRIHEGQAQPPQTNDPHAAVEARDLRGVLDEELDRLPDKYRAPLVLCYLQGKTYTEAAKQLGWKDGTVCGRLARARELLRHRLVRRGVALSPAALVEPMAAPTASVAAVLRTAALFALGESTAGPGPTPAVTLAQGVLHSMAVAKLKTVVAVVLAVCVFAAGAGWAAHQVLAPKPVETIRENQANPTAVKQVRNDFYGDPLPPGALARMGSVQLRHWGAHVVFSADGKTLISAGPDGVVSRWDVATGKEVRHKQLRPPNEPFLHFEEVALAPNGRIVAGWNDESVCLHDTDTGRELHRLPMRGRALSEPWVFSPDGKILAMARAFVEGQQVRGYRIHLWDVFTGKERLALKFERYIQTFAFSPDGKRLASVAGDRLHLWDAATGRELRNAGTDGGSLTFSPDGKSLAVCDSEGVVTLWETATLKQQTTLKPPSGVIRYYSRSRGLAFSPDGTLLAVGGDTALLLWDVAGRKEQGRFPEREIPWITFSPDGKTLACSGKREIHLWDVATGRPLHARPGHDNHVDSIAVSPDGKILASSAFGAHLRLWDTATGKPLAVSPTHDALVRSCAFASDGRLLVTGVDNVLRLLEPTTGKELRRFTIDQNKPAIYVSHLSADGNRLAAISIARKTGLQLDGWDARTGKLMVHRPIRGRMSALSASCFSPDGNAVTVMTGQSRFGIQREEEPIGTRLSIEETVTGRQRLTISRNLEHHPIAFSLPDGALLAAGFHSGGATHKYQVTGVSLIEAVTGEEALSIDGPFNHLAFSADGRLLATNDAVGAGGIRIWDVATGKLVFQRRWPDGLVHHPDWSPAHSLAFLPGGRALATGMEDGTVLVWDLAPQTWPKTTLAGNLNRKELDALWAALAGDARKAHRALYTLATAPAQSLPFLAEHLQPTAVVDAQRVEKLLADLDSEQFAVRDRAAKELTRMGEQIEPALRRMLEGKPSLEVRSRIQAILDALGGVPPAATLRTLRAIRALERIGTPEARRILHTLASGAAGARETREAKAALERLEPAIARQP